jgi:hypothetical protein
MYICIVGGGAVDGSELADAGSRPRHWLSKLVGRDELYARPTWPSLATPLTEDPSTNCSSHRYLYYNHFVSGRRLATLAVGGDDSELGTCWETDATTPA